MRSRLKIGLVLAMVTIGVFYLTQLVSWAQESAEEIRVDERANDAFAGQRAALAAQEAQMAVQREFKIKGGRQSEGDFVLHVRNELGREIRQAAKMVNEAEGDEAKEAAQSQLNDFLERYFDVDMQRRVEELAKIEERLAKLRGLLERRLEKKGEIIDLQSKVALNEAAGLGFYSSDSPGMPTGFRFETGNSYLPGESSDDFWQRGQRPARIPLPPSTADPAAAPAPPWARNAPVALPPTTVPSQISR